MASTDTAPQRSQTTDKPPSSPDRPPQRDPFFDNAKYLAIVLVAVGHAWEPLRGDSRVVLAVYMAVYAFHMPAFILIAGYFSRNFDAHPERVRRLITTVAVPYVIFQIIYTVFNRWIKEDPDVPVRMFNPWWITWFLMALFIWRLTAPLWRVVRWPVPVALGIASLAAASSYLGGNLDLQRVLQFLPYFVLGTQLRAEHFQLVRHRVVRACAVPVLALAAVTAYWAVPRMNYQWLFHRDGAEDLGAPWWAGVAMQLGLFACAVVLIACFFALVPGRNMWFTVLGTGTLYGYLLHVFPAKGAIAWGWYDAGVAQGAAGAVLITCVAVLTVTLLCSRPVQRTFRFLIEPKLERLFRRDPGPPGNRAPGG
jgi:fucose 4-O-acetylase-like acetyltransferase